MKKILLLTWYDNQNYGTSLQANSLCSIIETPSITGLNYNLNTKWRCDVLKHRPIRQVSKIRRLLKLFSIKTYRNKIGQIKDNQVIRYKRQDFDLRKSAFDAYTEKNFRFATHEDCQTIEELVNASKEYDVVMCGSDQVWNPEALDQTYLLTWVPLDKKKISYGSSLSVKTILPEYHALYESTLSSFSAISIRDVECRSQLSKIIGKPVSTVVDPVILLGGNALRKEEENIDLPKSPFVFCYFLGNNYEHRKKAIEFASRYKMDIVAIIHCGSGYRADSDLEPYAIWDVNPNQFISCIDHAGAVFTDSFHATVISTLLHTEFFVFEKDSDRPEQNTRIREFLTLANLENRWDPTVMETNSIVDAEWVESDKRIQKKRQESMDYLMRALENA